jgi:hypothetical protein
LASAGPRWCRCDRGVALRVCVLCRKLCRKLCRLGGAAFTVANKARVSRAGGIFHPMSVSTKLPTKFPTKTSPIQIAR